MGSIDNIPALVQIMAWRRLGDKPLSEPMIVYWRIYASLGLNELNLNLAKSRSSKIASPVVQTFWNFAQHGARQYHCRVLCKIQNGWACEEWVIGKLDLARFDLK